MERLNSISLLYPPFASKILQGLDDCHKLEIPLQVFETYRTRERQDLLFNEGRNVTRSRAGQSWHQYGIACDLVLRIKDQWAWEPEHLYKTAGPIFRKYGLEWCEGKAPKFELCHYQMKVNCSISVLEKIFLKDGMVGVWKFLDETHGEG